MWWWAAASATVPEAPPFATPDVIFERPGSEMCFPSGFRVTVIPDSRQPVVSVTMVVDRGSAADPVGKEGSAHLLEHLWFRARPGGAAPVALRLDDVGATHNAFTLADTTVFSTVVGAAGLGEVLRLEASRLTDPLAEVTDAVFAEERRVVASEHVLRGLVLDDLPRLMPSDLHGRDARLRPTSSASVAGLTRADVQDVAAAYVPWTTTLHIVGDVRPSEVQTLIEASFPEELLYRAADGSEPAAGSCGPRRSAGDSAPPPPVPQGGPPFVVEIGVDDPMWLVGWSAPPAFGAQEPSIRLAAAWLESALEERLSGSRFAAVERGCLPVPGARRSAILCFASIPDGSSATKIRERLIGAASDVETSASAESIRWYTQRLRTDVALSIDHISPTTSDDALRDALSNHFVGRPDWFIEALEGFDQLDATALRSYLDRWTTPGQARWSLLVPPGTDTAALLARGGRDDDDGQTREAIPDVAPVPLARHHAEARTTGRPTPIATALPRLETPVVGRLPNGLSYVILPHGTAPIAQVVLVAGGGVRSEPALGVDAWGWAHTTVDATQLPERSLGVAAGALSASWWTWRRTDGLAIGLTGSSATVDGQLWFLRNFAESATVVYDDAWWEDSRTYAREAAARDARNPGHRAAMGRMAHVLGPTHPAALSGAERLHLAATTKGKVVTKHHAATWRPANVRLVVVGAVDPTATKTSIERWFGSWSGGSLTPQLPVDVAAAPPAVRAAFVGVDPSRATAAVTLSCRVDSSREDATSDVGVALLEEATWRLLRESDIGAYDPSVWPASTGDAELLHLRATVAPEAVGAASVALHDVVSGLAANGPSGDDLPRAIARVQGRWAQRFVDTDQVIAAALDGGRDTATLARTRPAAHARVTVAAVQSWLGPCAAGAALSVIGPNEHPLEGTVWEEVVTDPTRLPGLPGQ